jgi:hypothetical protein
MNEIILASCDVQVMYKLVLVLKVTESFNF